MSVSGILRAKSSPIFVKWRLNASAISPGELKVWSPALISGILVDLFCRLCKSFISFQVFLGSFLLAARLVAKYLRFSYLIELFTSFRAVLYCSQLTRSFVDTSFLFKKSLLCILRINSQVIHGDVLFRILFVLSGACLSMTFIKACFHACHISFGFLWELTFHCCCSKSRKKCSLLKF